MPRRRKPERPRKTTRRWHIPPPLVHGSEALEGGQVLEENPSRLGVLLWQALRDVLLWVQTPPEERAELFTADAPSRREAQLLQAGVEPELATALQEMSAVLADPAGADPDAVAAASREVVQWAEGVGHPQTALAFAQNVALVLPTDAAAALQVGRIARGLADHARAEVWFRRALGLARQARDWRLYARAFGGLGNLYVQRGNLPAARRFHVRALRGARRGGMRLEQAAALHDLFCVEVAAGQQQAAESHARQVLELAGARSPRLPALAHDVAYLWMEQGHFTRALRVFQALLPLFADEPLEGLFARADVARAAGGVGNRPLFQQMFAEVMERAHDAAVAEGAARALLELAHGARSLGDWDRAEQAANRALELAATRGEAKIRLIAEALLDSIRQRGAAVRTSPPPAPASDSGDKLAAELVTSLEKLAATEP